VKQLSSLCLALLLAAPALGFESKDGDRVVLIGSTLIEREQRYGYWETALTIQNPDKNITFRNLGWSGDSVWGEARAEFGTVADGYKHLVDHVRAEKPTVIIVGYGTNESFAGEEGLPKFKEQLKKLLDDLSTTKARLILMSPPPVDEDHWKYGNAKERNRLLKLYGGAILDEAKARSAAFVPDIYQDYGPSLPLTDNGIHLNAWGYRFTAYGLLNELKVRSPDRKTIELNGRGLVRVTQPVLPPVPSPLGQGVGELYGDSLVHVKGLEPGNYTLQIDGRAVHTLSPAEEEQFIKSKGEHPVKGTLTRDADRWKRGIFDQDTVLVLDGPSLDQGEKLRQTIIAKNELYFHRWRPQNTTYLFGFRKHEQGQNAREIPQFDPLVAAKEKEIAELKKPREHIYELVPANEKK